MGLEKDKWYEVIEDERIYFFPDTSTITVKNIRRMRVSPNHTHFIEDKDGTKYIIRNTWNAIKIGGDWAI